ncbi:uncharacterized protein CCOS01_00468 [Colletotrichum costaricense]|uniref:Secreted protein n=2 Tax=Colletotrichum acutatum species complex TaxID=2707335 RepID=A0AAI9Z936_9PEZI|nr:uncharacterized protein CCOS01_00468 [Colletotrichum costaricense]XP_060374923.1 uncharacterized protein CTAM01_14475 [Colletotrichum tamarilloi]KAK1480205.1 hypothetical protein CTAM01_14475 [Colletotrichum tamarilloi]KAK1539154.1 hypothetical protein CCOS01_00468 [Colletotrichum costaricense]
MLMTIKSVLCLVFVTITSTLEPPAPLVHQGLLRSYSSTSITHPAVAALYQACFREAVAVRFYLQVLTTL